MHASLAGPNAIAPERMTPEERVAEIGRILALGLIRLHTDKSSSLSAGLGDSCLDFLPHQRRHGDRLTRGKTR